MLCSCSLALGGPRIFFIFYYLFRFFCFFFFLFFRCVCDAFTCAEKQPAVQIESKLKNTDFTTPHQIKKRRFFFKKTIPYIFDE